MSCSGLGRSVQCNVDGRDERAVQADQRREVALPVTAPKQLMGD